MEGREFQELLESMAAGISGVIPDRAKAFRYSSIYSFVAKEGLVFEPMNGLPEDIKRMEMGMCFQNALTLAMDNSDRFVYIEGFVMCVIPIAHAWCATLDGTLVDPTIQDGEAYVGVPFALDYALSVAYKRGRWGVIDNWENRFPLLTGEHDDYRDKRFLLPEKALCQQRK